jgi:signal peptidase I
MEDRPADALSDAAPENAAPPLPPSPPPKRKKRSDAESGANVKETLESILVAFVLAFIFRCFIVEAFVIPTGSMAPTLMGAHTRHVCQECGYSFEVEFSPHNQSNDDESEIPAFAGPYFDKSGQPVPDVYSDVRCPNCGYRLPTVNNPPVFYGDRILVLKYAYLLEKPKRWDVVVFKTPVSPHRFEWNFIKRLTGLPGETIMVLDGDIYAKAPGGDHFVVQPKTREAQEAMWRIIYDDDYRPINSLARKDPWIQPWQPVLGTGWIDQLPHPGHGFTFDNLGGHGTMRFNSTARQRDNNIDYKDWLAYDQAHNHNSGRGYDGRYYEGRYTVSDLKLDCYYERREGTGPLKLEMSKLDDRFVAELLPDKAVLHHESKGKEVGIPKSVSLANQTSGPRHVELLNVDYRVTLRIDGHDVIQTTPKDYQPDINDLMERTAALNRFEQYTTYRGDGSGVTQRGDPFPLPVVQIEADRQTCELKHVSLRRDVYYTPQDVGGTPITYGLPVAENPNSDAGPVHLGSGEYFVMGDNSPLSYDARFWNQPIDLPDEKLFAKAGRVPERFMLGRAFFVYWPAGFRPTEKMPGIIPNFGQMRFIR